MVILRAAHAGKDVNAFVPELVEHVLETPCSFAAKRAGYAVLAAGLARGEPEWARVEKAMRLDMEHVDASVRVAAWTLAASLPSRRGADFLLGGGKEISASLKADSAEVRAAAVQGIAGLLLRRDVLGRVSESEAAVEQTEAWADAAITAAVEDDGHAVAAAAFSAAAELLRAGEVAALAAAGSARPLCEAEEALGARAWGAEDSLASAAVAAPLMVRLAERVRQLLWERRAEAAARCTALPLGAQPVALRALATAVASTAGGGVPAALARTLGRAPPRPPSAADAAAAKQRVAALCLSALRSPREVLRHAGARGLMALAARGGVTELARPALTASLSLMSDRTLVAARGELVRDAARHAYLVETPLRLPLLLRLLRSCRGVPGAEERHRALAAVCSAALALDDAGGGGADMTARLLSDGDIRREMNASSPSGGVGAGASFREELVVALLGAAAGRSPPPVAPLRQRHAWASACVACLKACQASLGWRCGGRVAAPHEWLRLLSLIASAHPAKAVGEDPVADDVQGLLASLLALVGKLPAQSLQPCATWIVAQHLASPAPGGAIARVAVASVEHLLEAGDAASMQRSALAAVSESSGVIRSLHDAAPDVAMDACAAEAALQSALAFAQCGGSVAEELASVIERHMARHASAADAPSREAALVVASRLREAAVNDNGASLVAADEVGGHSAELPFGSSAVMFHTPAALADRALVASCRRAAADEMAAERCARTLNARPGDPSTTGGGADMDAAQAGPISRTEGPLGALVLLGAQRDGVAAQVAAVSDIVDGGGLLRPWCADAPAQLITGASDPLAVEATLLPDAAARCVRLSLRVTNATELTITKAAVRVGLVGPLAFYAPAAHCQERLPRLLAQDSCDIELKVACTAVGRGALCLQLLLYPDVSGPDDDEEDFGADAHAPPLPDAPPRVLRCAPMALPLTAALMREMCAPGDFFARWDSLPYATSLRARAVAGHGGASHDALVAACEAAARRNFAVVEGGGSSGGAAALGSQRAALLARTWWGDAIAIVLTRTHTGGVAVSARSSSAPLARAATADGAAFLADAFGDALAVDNSADAAHAPRREAALLERPAPAEGGAQADARARRRQEAEDRSALTAWRALKA